MLDASLFIRRSIHQGDSRFSDISRGRQFDFMSLSALLFANDDIRAIFRRGHQKMDRTLAEGDFMFLKDFEESSIPDEETFPLNYLPDRVLWSTVMQNQSAIESNKRMNQSLDEANKQNQISPYHQHDSSYLDLHSALMNDFFNNNYAFIILKGYIMALIKHSDYCIYVFDSHARNFYGMSCY